MEIYLLCPELSEVDLRLTTLYCSRQRFSEKNNSVILKTLADFFLTRFVIRSSSLENQRQRQLKLLHCLVSRATYLAFDSIMAGTPREQWERLQVLLQNRSRQGGFRFRGVPSGGPLGALIFLGIAGYAFSASLFNGSSLFHQTG
jgi:hypothetical protein